MYPSKPARPMNEVRCLWKGQIVRLCYVNDISAWIKVYRGPEMADAVEHVIVPINDLWLSKKLKQKIEQPTNVT